MNCVCVHTLLNFRRGMGRPAPVMPKLSGVIEAV